MKIAWNKIGLGICILILVIMLVVWVFGASFVYCGYFSEVMQDSINNLSELVIHNAIIGLLFYVLPILLVLKNIKLLIEIYKTERCITRNDMYSLLYIVLQFYLLLIYLLLIFYPLCRRFL